MADETCLCSSLARLDVGGPPEAAPGTEEGGAASASAGARMPVAAVGCNDDERDVPRGARSDARPAILCDAWYGFPSQKRPRRERVNAVSRQLSNFLEWRRSAQPRTAPSSSSSATSHRGEGCQVSLLGSAEDVEAVRRRMAEIDDGSRCSGMAFRPDVDVLEYANQQSTNNDDEDAIHSGEAEANHDSSTAGSHDEVVYLSPDATDSLPTTSPPPRVVVVGMLIDRRVKADRSRARAEEALKVRSARLPLDELNVKELSSSEPLNVDTVMELVQRWWWNCEELERGGQVPSEASYRKCFVDAAARAMKTQRDRHPNRTIHLAGPR